MPSLEYPNKQVAAQRYILSLEPTVYAPLWKKDGLQFVTEDATGHLCTATGAVWTAQGRYCDGTDDRVTIAHHPSMSSLDYTVSVWFKVVATPAASNDIIIKRSGNAYHYHVYYNPTNSILFQTYDGVNNPQITLAINLVPVGKWAHFTVVRNTRDDYYYAYINGGYQAKVLDSITGTLTNTADISIGAKTDGTNPLNVVVGDVVICPRPLFVGEIHTLFSITRWRYQ